MRPSQRFRKLLFPYRRRLRHLVRADVWSGGPPAGMFSEADELGNGTVEGAMTTGRQTIPEIPENSEIRMAGLNQHRHSDWKILWTRRSDVLLAGPSMVHIDDRGFACVEAMYGPHGWADPVWERRNRGAIRVLSGDHTCLVSRWNNGRNYFHWFMDGLTRLVHLADFPDDCRIIIPAGLPAFARRSLELLALSDRVVETSGEDLRIERYWFGGPTMLSGCPDPMGVSWLREKLLPPATSRPHRKLYIERVAPTRNLLNAAEIRERFLAHGWEIIDPAQYPLDEQIRLFQEASAVAGVHGAAFTNLLWATQGTRVLELMPHRRRNGCYAGISLVLGLDHHCLVCPSDRGANLTASASEIEKRLEIFDNH